MDLKTCMSFTGKREFYVVKYKAGVDSGKKLQYVDIDFYMASGWNASETMSMAETVPFAQGSYNSATWSMTPMGVITDTPRGTATRSDIQKLAKR